MIYRRQLIKGYDPERDVYGDCFRTCLACLLDLEPEVVPHFMDGVTEDAVGVERCQTWLKQFDLVKLTVAFPGEVPIKDVLLTVGITNPGVRYTLSGESPRGCNHTVVCLDGEIEWCPSIGRPERNEEIFVGPCLGMDEERYWFVNWIGKLV